MNNYNLNTKQPNLSIKDQLKTFSSLAGGEFSKLIVAIFAVLINSGATIITPFIISIAIDDYISTKNLSGLNMILLTLLIMYFVVMVVSYLQTRLVGQVSQRVLYKLREKLFGHLQDLPVSFFQQNKAGDVITRINSDTEKINNFLSGSIFQFVSSFVVFIGIGIFIFFLNWQLALMVWSAVILLAIVSQTISKTVSTSNAKSLSANGDMIGFLDENLNNYKALVAFNKGEYLRDKFNLLSQNNMKTTVKAQALNGFFNPFYSFIGNIAQVLVLAFGLYLFSKGSVSVGLLIGFITYTQKFYEPLRTLGNIWGGLQEALAAWARVQALLNVK